MWVKKTLVIIGLCLLIGYLIFAFFFFEEKPLLKICNYFHIETVSDQEERFINIKLLEKQIDERGLNPYGKQLKEINTLEIQKTILENKQIKTAEVFITNDGGVRVLIKEKVPLFRVILSSGDSFYIDVDGNKMPLSKSNTAYLPVVTGFIKDSLAMQDLYNFVLFISKDKFWNAQIEQIIVDNKNEITLLTRVGDHDVILGKLENYKLKLNKLKVFYNKVLPTVGWNRYKTLNLKYNDQVVGTKR